MAKRGLDQITAWALATVLSGIIFGAAYGLTHLGSHTDGSEDPESAAAIPPENAETPKAAPVADVKPAPADTAAVPAHTLVANHEEPAGSPPSPADQGNAAATVRWGYKGSYGPKHWGELAEAFKTCATGRQQSPVDIDQPVSSAKLLPLRFHYKKTDAIARNDGHSLVLEVPTGNYVEIDGERYDLKQLRFHAPSEHKVAGAPYDFEVQLVHASAAGKKANVAVLFEEGAVNRTLAPLLRELPDVDASLPEPISIDPGALLPAQHIYYHYTGSLTAPPCTENVAWYVLKRTLPISAKQIDAYARVLPFDARPVQPLYGRKVLKSQR